MHACANYSGSFARNASSHLSRAQLIQQTGLTQVDIAILDNCSKV